MEETKNIIALAVNENFAERTVFVGTETGLTEEHRGIKFVLKDYLKDRVIIISKKDSPITNRAVTVEQIKAYYDFCDSIKSPYILMKPHDGVGAIRVTTHEMKTIDFIDL